jgi:hypothetical protein
MTPLAHHGAIEAIALFIPALAIVCVIAGAVLLDRRRGGQQDAELSEDDAAEKTTRPS